jgi:ribosomal protein S18 acetylase RimI-like enzyme
MTLSARRELANDEPFLRHLIIATVAEQLMAAAWPEEIRESLLDMQYRGRLNSIRANFPDGESLIVQVDGQSAGWLFVSTQPDEIRLVEIMILPEHRGKGIGSVLIQDLISKAERAHLPARLSVDVMNGRAIQLYLRLGFRRAGGDEVRHFMEISPTGSGCELGE